jgi:hypothetical protein
VSADFHELHPLSAFLAPWLADGVPDLDALNGIAPRRHPDRWWRAAALRPPRGRRRGLRGACLPRGEVATRPDNRHDLFNALIWLAFPRSKAAINRRHHEALLAARGREATGRGPCATR